MISAAFLVLTALAPAPPAQDEETTVESPITSVGLFKNGLAVVRRSIRVPGPGQYVLRGLPDPVHGTFWMRSEAEVVARLTTRDAQVSATGADLTAELAGLRVTIHFKDGQIPPVTGTVLVPDKPRGGNWDRAYEQPDYWRSYYRGFYSSGRPMLPPRLMLETDTGRAYVEPAMIAYAQAEGGQARVTRPQPALLLSVGGQSQGPVSIEVGYLAKGIGWAASYRVDVSDPKELLLEQQAVVRNELEDLAQAEIELVSGFPSIRFSHVDSPLSARTTWAQFFQQLSSDPSDSRGNRSGAASQVVASNFADPFAGLDLSAAALGEGPDIHYQPAGRHSLEEGECLALTVASGRAAYERVIEWTVPDTSDAQGNQVNERERQRQVSGEADEGVWEVLHFRNPLTIPMTTGPAAVHASGRFLGQQLSSYVSPGEMARLRVTRSLGVRTRATEKETGERDSVVFGGHTRVRSRVSGELEMSNHRAEAVELVVRRRLSGELVEADGEPRVTLLEEGSRAMNRRVELVWSLRLEPGEARKLAYQYTVLSY